ncbi:MAG TPA: hypothetical protein VF719_05610, partial [Abditibacteriaceae bacterium]
MAKKRILFISHAATRTGAPMMLLHLLRWLAENSDFECDLLLLRGGPLESEFYKVTRPVAGRRFAMLAAESAALQNLLPHLHPRLKGIARFAPLLRGGQSVARR